MLRKGPCVPPEQVESVNVFFVALRVCVCESWAGAVGGEGFRDSEVELCFF